ncbi:FAD/NAD(P)-binding domain-containing protein [Corynebacterium propinquum]|uniref:FAD/NAD(P)-binding protein n=1 Tax=Corynebacterium propinquum TaxID=43769 RepID=UPI00036E8F25|nr:FAD/NAD(P)-binding protein [Corynebacterium propinquum]MDK4291605.1 FAD/NAD(P)-binding protein [Corynebacterium propinquum]QQU90451.1 FAD/NAD(P)-binding protein [Corynebacterium propinquum]
MSTTHIALIGAGPRGISVLERLAAYLQEASGKHSRPGHAQPSAPRVTVHIIDDSQIGAGRVWDTDQTRTLCMNTLADAVTLFTEPGSSVGAPVLSGPTLYEWIRLLRGDDLLAALEAGSLNYDTAAEVVAAKQELFRQHPPRDGIAEDYREELAGSVEQSNPSRALYGEYLRWVYRVAVAQLPDSVDVVEHNSRAISIQQADIQQADRDAQAGNADSASDYDAADVGSPNYDLITLADGTTISAHATVLATGWVLNADNDEQYQLRAANQSEYLRWIGPNNPVEQPVETIPAGKPVLVRGLGMGFFDLMALCTLGRGGFFEVDPTSRSGLRYRASGTEPQFVVTSRRGYPFLPKSDYGSLPPKAQMPRLQDALAAAQDWERIDFSIDFAPSIIRDAFEAFYRTLAHVRPDTIVTSLDEIVSVIDSTPVHVLLDSHGVHSALARHTSDFCDLQPYFHPRAESTSQVADSLARDIDEALKGTDSPIKAALWVFASCRKHVGIAGSQGKFTPDSASPSLQEVMALGQMVGSGPPLFRSQQLLALVDAGLVEFLGAYPQLEISADEFTLTCGSGVTARRASAATLVDAWLPKPDIRFPADLLSQSLYASGRIRPFVVDGVQTGSPETDTNTRRTIHPDGVQDSRLHIIGIPTHAQMPDTTISPMPGTDPLMLQETDHTARSLHAIIRDLPDATPQS